MASPRSLAAWIVAVLCLPAAAGAQVIERISVSSAGVGGSGESRLGCREAPISSDGRYVVFESDAPDLAPDDFNGVTDIFGLDRTIGDLRLLTVNAAGQQTDGFNHNPKTTRDGRLLLFQSAATNLVAGDTNNALDVFLAYGPAILFGDGFEVGSTAGWPSVYP